MGDHAVAEGLDIQKAMIGTQIALRYVAVSTAIGISTGISTGVSTGVSVDAAIGISTGVAHHIRLRASSENHQG
jgi:hypothetical protein